MKCYCCFSLPLVWQTLFLKKCCIIEKVYNCGRSAFGRQPALSGLTGDNMFRLIFTCFFSFLLLTASAVSSYAQEAGDRILFGRYPQGAGGRDMPIEWMVLQKNRDGSIYVLSVYGLDGKLFDGTGNKWKKSELRKWLKKDFKNKAFTKFEQKAIVKGEISIMSAEEARRVFPDDADRRLYVTDYASRKITQCSSCGGSSWWWLRDPGPDTDYNVVYVDAFGNINAGGMPGNMDNVAIRPIMQLNLKKIERFAKNSFKIISPDKPEPDIKSAAPAASSKSQEKPVKNKKNTEKKAEPGNKNKSGKK